MATSSTSAHDAMVFIKREPQDDGTHNTPTSHVKQEPQDDEDLFIPDAGDSSDSTGLPPPRSSKRATTADGHPFNSQCFERPYLSRPQFHRLKCGHDIATTTIEPCGYNCHPPSYFTGSDQKPNHTSFECPHPQCKKQAEVMPRRNPKTNRRIYGRTCVLAHVRGRNLKADKEWDNEKERRAAIDGRLRTRPRGDPLARKTSRSPVRLKPPVHPPNQRARRASSVLTVEEVVRAMDSADRQLFAAQKGKHTRKPRGDRPETPFDLKMDAAEQDLAEMRFKHKSVPSKKGKNAKKPATRKRIPTCSEDNEPDQAVEQDGDAEEEQTAAGDDADEVYCVCESSDAQWMVECNDCDEPFHPGCIGKGAQDKAQYELPNREEFFEFDARNSTSAFLCLDCENRFDAGESSKRRTTTDHFKRSDLQLEFLPKLIKQKQAALGRALTDEQRAVVETYFASIEQEMRDCASVQSWDWKSLLAKALRVPLPVSKTRKRGAAEVDPENMRPDESAMKSIVRIGTSKADPSPSKITMDARANAQSSRPSAATQVYRKGGEVTLTMGPPKSARGNVM